MVFTGCSLFAALAIGQLFWLQVLEHQRFLAEADLQHKLKIVLPPRRGDILDRNGGALALSAEGLDVYAVPEKIKNRKKVSALLARYLKMPEGGIAERISQRRPFVMLRQKVNPVEIRELTDLELEGIGFIPSSKRYYPHNNLASQLIGYVGVDEIGLAGVEFAWQESLCGKPGWLVVQRDARGKPYNVLDYPVVRQTNGLHIRLTIEAQFQEIVEETLGRAVVQSGARSGCVVAVRPQTGEILALANYPGFDLNRKRSFGDRDFLNLATNLPFEPGSTFKPFTASALLAGGHVTLGDSVFCENGAWQIRSRTIRDVHRYGRLSFRDVIAKSSNIGMAKLIQRIGGEDLYRVLRGFGFGAYTGSAFSGEDHGRLSVPAKWDGTTKTSLAIGYAILVTPLQMAMAYAALANGGELYEPVLVSEVLHESGRTVERVEPRRVRRVLPEKVVETLKVALVAVVDSGTGTAAAVPGFKSAGKTGTSMKADPGSGYGGNGYISSFGGFFPADSPQIAMYILINDPDYEHRWGGSCAAPVFGEIIRNTLLSASTVIDRGKLGLPEHSVPASNLAQSPPAGTLRSNPLPSEQARATAADSGVTAMPALVGLSMRKALACLTALGLEVKVEGSVLVSSQAPPAGTPVKRGGTVNLFGLPPGENKSSFSLAISRPQGAAAGSRQNRGETN
ncbi:MAG: penicillin-binding protein [Candidatus Glassbacteria bacterium]